jgi:hypothetical protein
MLFNKWEVLVAPPIAIVYKSTQTNGLSRTNVVI